MKKILFLILLVLALPFLKSADNGANASVDRTVVPLSKPGQPVHIEVESLAGSITVSGYDGREVIVEARPRGQEIAGEENNDSRHGGMKRLNAATGTGLVVSEEDNIVHVAAESFKRAVDITLKVPYNADLKLRTVNAGEIVVDNVSGEIETRNVNGPIRLSAISGSVVASTTNGEVKVTFKKINLQKPMSFVSFNGDVDVTFPADLKADIRLKTEQGDIYSDFEIAPKAGPQKTEEKKKEGKRFVIRFDKSIFGTIGGGGQELQFSTFNGDILLRRSK